MAPRTAWKGVLAYSAVQVPVKLYKGMTESGDLPVHQVTEDGTRIRYQRVKEGTDEEIPWADIRKGVDLGGGQVTVLDDDALSDTRPENNREITVIGVIDVAGIPAGDGRTYWLHPDKGGDKGYRLVADALARNGKALAVTLVFSHQERLAIVTVTEGRLYLATIPRHEDLRAPDRELPQAPVTAQEAQLADEVLLDVLPQGFDWAAHPDASREKLLALAQRTHAQAARATEIVPAMDPSDIMALLVASVEDIKAGRGSGQPPVKPVKVAA